MYVYLQLYHKHEAVTWTCMNTIIHSAGQLAQHEFMDVCFLCSTCGLTEKRAGEEKAK